MNKKIEAREIPEGNHKFWVLIEEEGDTEWEWFVGNANEAHKWVQKEFNEAIDDGSKNVTMTVYPDNFLGCPDCTVDYYFQLRTADAL